MTSPVSVIILARADGNATTRAVTAALAHSDDVMVLTSSEIARSKMEMLYRGVAVRFVAFRNPAEAISAAEPRHDYLLWLWAEELPDDRAWHEVDRIARSGRPGAYHFEQADFWRGRAFPSPSPLRPAVRMWSSDNSPLSTDGFGLAVVGSGSTTISARGKIRHLGIESPTTMVKRTDYEIGCIVHAAVERGLQLAPEAICARALLASWAKSWVQAAWRGPTLGLVTTFMNCFWVPLFLNARLREATRELQTVSRSTWLEQHTQFDGHSA